MALAWDTAAAPEHVDEAGLVAAVTGILDSTALMSVATTLPDGGPWINNAYFAYDEDFRLYFLSRPLTVHSENVRAGTAAGGRVAVTVADSQQPAIPGRRRGLQLEGRCRVAAADVHRAITAFSARFPSFAAVAATTATPDPTDRAPRLYVVSVATFKLFHEPVLGTDVWLSGRVTGEASLATPVVARPTARW